MSKRRHPISKTPLWTGSDPINEAILARKIEVMRLELLEDIPSLRSLQASEMLVELTPHEKSIHITAILLENDQSVLNYADTGANFIDLFQVDINRVKDDQAKITGKVIVAQSPATDPFGFPDVVAIRKRLNRTRSGHQIHVWTGPEANQLPMFIAPKYMPNGLMRSVSIRVKAMTSSWARIVLMEDLVFQTSVLRTIEKGKILKMLRTQEHHNIDSGHRLQVCMDTSATISIEAAIALFWEDGEVSHLELLSFDTKKEN